MATHAETYLAETREIANALQAGSVELLVDELVMVRDFGRTLYIAGLGGSAANASHAAADFRNLCGMKAICLSDSAAELTARANDQGWERIFEEMLAARGAGKGDALLVLSVGGGAGGVSVPLVHAIDYAKAHEVSVLGIVGRDGGHTAAHGDSVVVVPNPEPARVTPHAEGWQMVLIHCLVSHPALQKRATKW